MNRSKKLLLAGLILLIGLGSSAFSQSIKFTAKDIYNKNVTESIFADSKLTMINIWGTFCGPCIKEMPDLGKLNQQYNSKDFQIVGIVVDSVNSRGMMVPKTVESAKKIVTTTGADYIHIVPDSNLINGILEDVYAVPTTIFVDSKGNIVGKAYTGSRSYDDWKKIIDSLLK